MEEIIKKLDKKLKVLNYEYLDDKLIMDVERTNKSANCPCWGKKFSNIHSRYVRPIKDLPIQEYKVILNITQQTKCYRTSGSFRLSNEQFIVT